MDQLRIQDGMDTLFPKSQSGKYIHTNESIRQLVNTFWYINTYIKKVLICSKKELKYSQKYWSIQKGIEIQKN